MIKVALGQYFPRCSSVLCMKVQVVIKGLYFDKFCGFSSYTIEPDNQIVRYKVQYIHSLVTDQFPPLQITLYKTYANLTIYRLYIILLLYLNRKVNTLIYMSSLLFCSLSLL